MTIGLSMGIGIVVAVLIIGFFGACSGGDE